MMTAIILVGGKSKRMGTNKAFLKLQGKSFLELQIELLQKLFDEVIISANSPEDYEGFGLPVVTDIYPEKGPLGGIYTGLMNSQSNHAFIIACDMPFIDPDLINSLMNLVDKYDVVVPENRGRFEPLHAFYSKNCIPVIKEQLDKNILKITDFYSQVNVKKVVMETLHTDVKSNEPLTNLNTIDEYKTIIFKNQFTINP